MRELLAIYLSVAFVSLLALVGVLTVSVDQGRLRAGVLYLVSFSAGTLFGDTFLHLVPETVAVGGFGTTTGLLLLGGVVLGFAVEKYAAWHHHHDPRPGRPATMTYSVLLGDAVHNAIDGVVIAASYLASLPLGVATTVAIACHEIPQEIGDFGVLVYGGIPRVRALAYNFLTALTAFASATLVVVLAGDVAGLVRVLLPVAAGNFVYVAGSDLLPELVAETDLRRSTAQMATFLGGIGVMYLLAVSAPG
ncbi:MAG: ZIP family metal transporter [Halorientalis sp.]